MVLTVLAILTVVGLLAAAVGFSRMAWRILSGEEEFEPGGSYGRQAVGGYHEDRGLRRRSRLARLVRR